MRMWILRTIQFGTHFALNFSSFGLPSQKTGAQRLNEKEELLGMDVTTEHLELLQRAFDQLEPYRKLWALAEQYNKHSQAWLRGPMFQLDPAGVERTSGEMEKQALGL